METNWQPMTEEAWYAALAEVPAPPSCEFCGDTDGLVNDPTPHVPTLCLFCTCEAMAQVYPELVTNVGAVVARAASFQVAAVGAYFARRAAGRIA